MNEKLINGMNLLDDFFWKVPKTDIADDGFVSITNTKCDRFSFDLSWVDIIPMRNFAYCPITGNKIISRSISMAGSALWTGIIHWTANDFRSNHFSFHGDFDDFLMMVEMVRSEFNG